VLSKQQNDKIQFYHFEFWVVGCGQWKGSGARRNIMEGKFGVMCSSKYIVTE